MNPKLNLNEGRELDDLPQEKGLMENLAKRIRLAVLPLALFTGGCATVQSNQKTQNGELAEIEEIAPDIANRPNGFEKTKTVRTPEGLIFDLSTKFRVGGNPGFIVNFKMESNVIGADSPGRISAQQEAKATYGYDIVDPKELADQEDEARKKIKISANYLYILREAREALGAMVNFMKERKPKGFNADYGYEDFFEALDREMANTESGMRRWGVSVLAKPAENQAKKKVENRLGQEFTCYATGGKTPEQAAVAKFAKDANLSVAQVEEAYVPVIVAQPEGALRKMVAKMVKKSDAALVGTPYKPAETPTAVADKLLSQEFTYYTTGGKTPEQAAVAKFAKDTGLSVAQVEEGYRPEIVSQPQGPLRKTMARMVKKELPKAVEPTKGSESANPWEKANKMVGVAKYKTGNNSNISATAAEWMANECGLGINEINENFKFYLMGFNSDAKEATVQIEKRKVKESNGEKKVAVVDMKKDIKVEPKKEVRNSDMEIAKQLFRERLLPKIKFRYESALKRDVTLKGKFVIYFRIGTNGKMEELKFLEDTFGNPAFTKDVKESLELAFIPAQPETIEFEMPLVLAPSN